MIDEIYDISEKFPKTEIYNLTSQIQRASLSIALNVAEGAGDTNKVFKRYLNVALDSTKECVVCITVAKRRKYIMEEENQKLRKSLLVIAKMITNLKKYLTDNEGQAPKS